MECGSNKAINMDVNTKKNITVRVSGFFSYIKPSERTKALGSTQLLTEISTRIISWG